MNMSGILDYLILLILYLSLMLPFIKFWIRWMQRDLETKESYRYSAK